MFSYIRKPLFILYIIGLIIINFSANAMDNDDLTYSSGRSWRLFGPTNEDIRRRIEYDRSISHRRPYTVPSSMFERAEEERRNSLGYSFLLNMRDIPLIGLAASLILTIVDACQEAQGDIRHEY